MKNVLALLVVFAFQLSIVSACSCGGNTSFCDINYSFPNEHVFVGKILRHDSLFSEFELIEKLRGIELKDTVLIWDNPAPTNTCVGGYEKNTEYLGNVGDSILIILSKIDSVDTWGVICDYYRPLGVCSTPFLPITNKLIIGNLTETDVYTFPHTVYRTDSVFLNTFKQLYNGNGRALDCDLFVGLPDQKNTQPVLSIYPNPSKGIFNVESHALVKSIAIHDLHGRLLNTLDASATTIKNIDLSEYRSGLYLVHISLSNGTVICEKVIKQ